jgi:CubicO group peptidase (beta-lactamase class C family)
MAVTPVVEALQDQTPMWEPGTAHGYHAITYGWLAGELVRRVDGRPIGQYFADEVAAPLGLEFWIGLPESEEPRVSRLEIAPPPTDPQVIAMMNMFMGPGTNAYRALTLDGRIDGLTGDESPFNTRAVHATEMAAANGITNAASLARMYAATIGEVDGVRLIASDTMQAARTERVNGPDLTLILPTRIAAGFWLQNDLSPMIQEGSFGHAGAGGSLGYANPELGIGYGYVMNQMGNGIAGDPRTIGLNDAVLASL